MPAPEIFGRGVISAGPAAARGAIVEISDAVVDDPEATVVRLHEHWMQRTPVTLVLTADPVRIRRPQDFAAEPHQLTPQFTPWLDRLHHLIWINNVDLRSGEPVWWWARKAERLGAVLCTSGDGDILLADGRPAWIDGGPRDVRLAGSHTVVHCETVDGGLLTVMPAATASTAALAVDQLEAVSHAVGPARIIAPAGSGKTRVLTERARHLLRDRGYEPEGVLALAYNRRAREEMEARTGDVGIRIQTLNALGFELLREVRPGVSMLDERGTRSMLEQVLPPLQWRANTDPISPYVEAMTTIRLGMRNPIDVETAREDIAGAAEAFPAYRQAMLDRNAVDFDEQIYAAVEALLRNGELRRRWQQRLRHLLVDEFQDLRPLHLLFIRLLACPELDVFGVGDDDQVLYGYDGASPRFLIDFGSYFPGAAEHALTVNYRSPAAVTTAARTLLTHNRVRVDKRIEPGPDVDRSSAALAVRQHADTASAPAILRAIQEAMAGGADAADIAVLARVNSALLVPQVALREAGIAVNAAVRADLLGRTGTAAALTYLRIGAAGERIAGADIGQILRRPSRSLPPWFSERIQRRRSWSLDNLRVQDMPDKERSKLDRLVADLEAVQHAVCGGSTLDALRMVRHRIGLGGAMALLGRNTGADRSSHLDDLDALESVAGLHPGAATFESWLHELLSRPSQSGGVTLATVHSVKGMEWDHVVVIGASEGLMPHRQAEDVEEERRIFHVAITRARRTAVVLSDASRPSPFLEEMRAAWQPAPPAAPSPAAPGRAGDQIVPEVGMALVATGGIAGKVARITGAGVSLELGPGSKLMVKFGELVTVGGERFRLAPPRRGEGTRSKNPIAEGPVAEALRAWRSQRARSDGIAAFMVMANTTLSEIAERRPATLAELAGVAGIGPAKLERYGEEILAEIAAAN